jgi:hypothetical protein
MQGVSTTELARRCALAVGVLLLAGCGSSQPRATSRSAAPVLTLPQGHPQPIEPVAGAGSPIAPAPGPAQASVSVSSGTDASLAQPVSDAQVRQELSASGLAAGADRATLAPDWLALTPIDAPGAVQEVIAAGNQIARLPYRWGGGHLTYEDTAFDCSGSISFVFAAAGLLTSPVDSTELMRWGDPGPGRWITVFANPGHTFMYVAGLRFDTVALAETGSRWSTRAANEPDLRTFVIRHPPGL